MLESGRDSIISALHWGPLPEADGFYKTSGQHQVRRTDYASAFHTFGVEWSEDYLFTYIDSRLLVCLLRFIRLAFQEVLVALATLEQLDILASLQHATSCHNRSIFPTLLYYVAL